MNGRTTTDQRWTRIALGTSVVVTRTWRTPAGPVNDRFSAWTDHPAGLEGEVIGVTNAGFRGLEYSVATEEGIASGVSAADLAIDDDNDDDFNALDFIAFERLGRRLEADLNGGVL